MRHGAVLVIGGGIAGMQAALDCAEMGFKVYLLEKEPAIGGNMARLDKTFPTNDCAMCMMSPKLVETGRHLNIEIISYADLEHISGEVGNFTVTVKKHARFVDEEKCNGCGDCEDVCPVTVTDEFNGQLSQRKAIYRLYPQAIPNVYTIDKNIHPPPCRGTCPAGVNAQGYIALTAAGKFLDALAVVRERMPFAGICGRICHHPCEANCNRAQIDEAVSVRNIKRFLADHERELLETGQPIQPELPEPETTPGDFKETVAVVGAGPAGLTCAHDLAKLGYNVTIFEKETQPGGMMRWGIPQYRLDRDFQDYEINRILNVGDQPITLKTGVRLGVDVSIEQLKTENNALFVATGAPLAKKIPLEGSQLEGVYYGIPFLRQFNSGETPSLGKHVAVIGGGNVALDVARCALRINDVKTVSLFCLESQEEIPAHEWEIREAIEEGVKINHRWGPHRVKGRNGKAVKLELHRCTSVFDDEGNFRPQYNTKRKKQVPVDSIILAVGQQCDHSVFHSQLKMHNGSIAADSLTLETSLPGVFAGGDTVLGPASLVEAVAQGHRAAESIHRYLRNHDLKKDRHSPEPPAQMAEIPLLADRTKKPRLLPYTPDDAVTEAKRCLQCGVCSLCLQCVKACKAGAIDHAMTPEQRELKVGAVIVTSGYQLFDARLKAEYGLGRCANVVSSLQFERILSASGPFQGKLRRLSDRKIPRKIAWIQCVGSRDVTVGNHYCSAVCCMYATKAAVVAKEHEDCVQPTIFYIDMRTSGKGYQAFQTRAREKYGLRYVRSMVSSIKENPENQNAQLVYVDQDHGMKIVEEEFDLVVLCAGITAPPSNRTLARQAQLELDDFGFFKGQPFQVLRSSRPGVYLCGTAAGPKDIPQTIMESSAAAALCGELLQNERFSLAQPKQYPPEKDISDQETRIGVFVCHCGINIGSVIDVEHLTRSIARLPRVTHAEHFIYTCSQDSQERIKEIIHEKNLNRVIVASCTPRTHEPLFRETLREAGLNQFLFEMADIREQCSWVHRDEPQRATAKAGALVRGSVGKAALLEQLLLKRVDVVKAALVIGAGISGLTAALSLAEQGFNVFLVEKQERPGGHLPELRRSLEGYDWREYLNQIVNKVSHHPNIQLFLESEVFETDGVVGNFTSKIRHLDNSCREIRHGVTIIATGAGEYSPGDFYPKHPAIISQRELGKRLQNPLDAQTIVMIQCIGSRGPEHPYCSRVCCGAAINNALQIKEKNPGSDVYILYRDIATYGSRETYYRAAREKGVKLIHFPDERYPQVAVLPGQETQPLQVKVWDTVLEENLELHPDLLVLSTGVVPDTANNEQLARLFKLSLDETRFFMEAHVKLQPVDFANAGYYVCGLAHSPKYTEENITQALAAAGRAAGILSKPYLEVGGAVSIVNPDKCAACLTCVRECVFDAPFISPEGKAEIEAAKCRGCGNCAAACPAKAIQLMTFTDAQQWALFSNILKEKN